ncbi:UDP-sugar transporter UST74c-like isoform X2 [Aphelenchoides bicaudatus]|nr:UDP-sugar transporter UST74c-like isoform X2 [Aphelenchoides bicaudatus]
MGFSAEATVKTKWAKMNAALFYGICSFMMVFINKYILSVLEFPSFLIFGILQMIVTVICLYIASKCSLITLPRLGMSVPKKIFPLPLLFFISLVSGLGGTQKISLPMFTALRHTTIFVTMILEYIILGYDLSFDTYGYMLIFINNVTGALNGDFNSNSLLFYNALFMIPIGVVLAYVVDDFPKAIDYFQRTNSLPLILSSMGMAFFFGLMLNYAMMMCTEYNSALTTTFNTAITYIGMFLAGDYVFHAINFFGISLTVLGSSLYIYVTFKMRNSESRVIKYVAKSLDKV